MIHFSDMPRALLLCFLTTVLLAAIHFFALAFFWYWTYWWLDILMHFLGGLLVGFAVLWFFFSSSPRAMTFEIKRALVVVLASIIVVGVLWEAWEATAGIIRWPDEWQDSVFDIFSDIAGSLAALIVTERAWAGSNAA